MANSLSISDRIKIDHNRLNQLQKNYLISRGNTDDQQRLSNQFQQELIRHITAEEIILYPAFKKYLNQQGNQIVDQGHQEHQHMKNLLFILETTSITDPQYRQTFDQLIKTFNKHIQREEDINLPILENAITPDRNSSLAQAFQQTKKSNDLKVYQTSVVNPPL